jgi:hypothetical protein
MRKGIFIMLNFISKEPIDKGWSEDKKYCVTAMDGRKYLLRISAVDQYDKRKSGYERSAWQLLAYPCVSQ